MLPPESEIARLFGEWQAARERATAADASDCSSSDAWEAYVEENLGERDALEEEMVKHTPATPGEVAALVLAMTQWGEEPLVGYGFGDELVVTLKALARCPEEDRR